MTTLAALATKDALVMGCDSLGTATQWMLDPFTLIDDFFDPKNDYKIKIGADGKPLLREFDDLHNKAELIPYYHMTHVSKLFSLDPLQVGVMTTGITSIGSRTIKSIISEFKAKEKTIAGRKKRSANYTVSGVAQDLLDFIMTHYEPQYSKSTYKPTLETYDRWLR